MTRLIDVDERRARLARRHAVTPASRVTTVEDAAESMVVLHGTDPAGLFLSAWARVDGFHVKDLERALYEERSLVKHLAMRRTLFAVPRDLLPVVQAAASDRVADAERRRLAKEVTAAGFVDDGERWLADATAAAVAELAASGAMTSTELRTRVPVLDGSIEYGTGKSWAGRFAVVGRVLTCLSAAGTVVRADNQGSWGTSRPTWALMEDWLGAAVEPVPAAEARAALVARWLRTFGPGTEVDLKWWLGSTLTAVRAALRDVGAVEVDLDGRTGHVLPDDVDPVDPVDPWVALLPALDPTTMGWFERDWYLGPHKPQMFDSTGNGGAAIWVDGRIVGGWTVTPAGDVRLVLLEDVGHDARVAIDAEADRLTAWLGGTTVGVRFPAPLVREPRR
ncbi:winged helix DNA-binding domain-containing protein [Cellulomonas chitinilytica]|uniref:winged helix DNA-binding domain-containing protein n=1 Tax=Cellulomonas chitinilytica TaxID=398759 RepID=UPI001EF2D9C9|nr:winged helix DNA-binding domain-containing protein [Cellulomonas chitinilytica]